MIDVIVRYVRRLSGFSRNARLFLLSSIVSGLSFSLYSLFFNLYVVSQGYSRSFLGELQSMPHLIALIGTIPAGVLVDYIGRKRALVISNVCWTLSYLGIVLSSGPWLLRLSMIGFGVSQSMWMVSSAPFMMENSTEEERNTLFSANFGLQTLIGFLGTLVGGYLPTLFGNALGAGIESATAYGATMAVTTVLVALGTIPIFFIQERPRTAGAAPASFRPWRNLSKPGLAVRIFIPNIIISMGAAILIPYMNLFFKETYPISDTVLGTVFAISSVVTGVATLASPLLADRWGRIRSLVITELASIPFLLLIGFSGFFWVSAFSFWMRAALMNMGNPLYSAFAMEQFNERERATVSALMGMSWNIGWTVGPFLSGYMQEHPAIGFRPIFVVTCVLYVLAALTMSRFFQKMDDRQRRAAFLRRAGVPDLTRDQVL